MTGEINGKNIYKTFCFDVCYRFPLIILALEYLYGFILWCGTSVIIQKIFDVTIDFHESYKLLEKQ